MAISAILSGGYIKPTFNAWTKEFDLSSIDMQQDYQNMKAIITLRRGNKMVSFSVDASLFDMDKMRKGLREVKDMIYVQQKKMPPRLDLRYKAIENMNDFLTLVSRQREQDPREIDTVILTPEQVHTLSIEAMTAGMRLDLIGQPILTIYGYTIETKGQD